MKIEIDGNDSLSIEHMEEIHVFHKSMDLLTSSILNNTSHLSRSKPHTVCLKARQTFREINFSSLLRMTG